MSQLQRCCYFGIFHVEIFDNIIDIIRACSHEFNGDLVLDVVLFALYVIAYIRLYVTYLCKPYEPPALKRAESAQLLNGAISGRL